MVTEPVSPSDWELGRQGYQPPSLTVQLRQRTFVFPWHTFLLADGTDVEVRCTFHRHTVHVKGSGLSALLTDIADQRVIALTEPDRTAKFRERAGALVTGVTVVENK